MPKFDSPSFQSQKKPPIVQFGHNMWNKMTGKYERPKTEAERPPMKKREEIKKQSSKERKSILNFQSVNTYQAGEKLSPRETTQKIQNIFGNVSSVKMPRSNGSVEVATRRADGLFYFAGKNTPCYLDRGEQVIKDTQELHNRLPSSVQSVNTRTRFRLRDIFSKNTGNSSEPQPATLLEMQEKGEKINEKEYVEKYIPKKWRQVALDFIRRKPNALSTGLPIAIASARSKMGLFITKNGIKEFPIIIGEGGTQRGSYRAGTPKTPTDIVVKFNGVKIAASEYGDASKGGSKTVKGASLFASELADAGGKWWHGVADYRVPNGATHGCVGMRVSDAREIASVIRAQGGGYGFVSDNIQVG